MIARNVSQTGSLRFRLGGMAEGSSRKGLSTHVFDVDDVAVTCGELRRDGQDVAAVKIAFRLRVSPEQPFEVAMTPELAATLAAALGQQKQP